MMATRKQIRFRVKPESVDACLVAIREYASYVRDWVTRHGLEWTWTTYQEHDEPTCFVSVIWHASEAAEARHRDAEGTERFAKNLYPHVVEIDELDMKLVADSTREENQGANDA